ncbi:MAG TPA: acyl-CoA reductase [Gemmatimonadales bacterium]
MSLLAHPGSAERRPWHEVAARVRVLAPTGDGSGLAAFLDATHDSRAEPFAPARLDTLGRLSAALLADPMLRQDPATVSVAYWLRRAQLARLVEEHARRAAAEPDVLRVPVARVLHLAPSNVDTLFLYSWAVAYLCGNASVVRLSQEYGAVVAGLLRVIDALAADDPELAAANRFVTYGHDDAITTALSAWCAHRVIWGGDETVAAVRPLPLPSHASERVFGSKYSFAVLDAARYRAAPEEERDRIAAGFFNDLFWFDQMACSSPHVLFWVGPPEAGATAAREFERDLQAEVTRRRFTPPVSSAVHRRSFAFGLAASSDVRVVLEHPGFIGVDIRDRAALDKEMCGGGLFRHVSVPALGDVVEFVDEGDQTLTHWGFEDEALREIAMRAGARGLDRVVPIGQALAFDLVWDGFHLVDDMLRRVRVRRA